MDPNLAKWNAYLGPLLGFLFTACTLVYIAFNAHRTDRPLDAAAPARDPQANGV